MYVCVSECIYVCEHVWLYVYEYVYMCVNAYMHVCVVCVCMYVCMRLRACVCNYD